MRQRERNDINDADLNHAIFLSYDWKNRLLSLRREIDTFIENKQEIISISNNNKEIADITSNISIMTEMFRDINSTLIGNQNNPLSYETVEKITECEKYLYSCVMNHKVRNQLILEQEEHKIRELEKIIKEIDRLWDIG